MFDRLGKESSDMAQSPTLKAMKIRGQLSALEAMINAEYGEYGPIYVTVAAPIFDAFILGVDQTPGGCSACVVQGGGTRSIVIMKKEGGANDTNTTNP